MAQVILLSADGTQKFAGDLHVSRITWPHASTRQFGDCDIAIPRGHRLALAALDREGGTQVRVQYERLGPWAGRVITDAPRLSETHVTFTARQMPSLIQTQPLLGGQTFRYLPAGVIARAAVRQVKEMVGEGYLREGAFAVAPPLIPFVKFEGQECVTLLNELQEQTGQEWAIDADGAVSWLAGAAPPYGRVLTEGGDVVLLGEDPDTTRRVSRVTPLSRTGKEGVAAVAEDLLVREARHIVLHVDSDSDAALAQAARAELAARRFPIITYQLGLLPGPDDVTELPGSGGGGDAERLARKLPRVASGGSGGITVTPSAHWRGIREGSTIAYCLPGANPYGSERGVFAVGRVLMREYGDSYPYVVLTVHELRLWDARTIAAALERQRPSYLPRDTWERRLAALVAGGAGSPFAQVHPSQLSGVLDNSQVAAFQGVSAGVATASKAVLLGAGKTLDELNLTTADITTLKKAGTTITASGTELNKLTGVTAIAADFEKTKVAAWEAGATENPQQAAVAAVGGQTIGSAGGGAASQTDTQNAVDALQAKLDELIGKTGNAGAKIHGG